MDIAFSSLENKESAFFVFVKKPYQRKRICIARTDKLICLFVSFLFNVALVPKRKESLTWHNNTGN